MSGAGTPDNARLKSALRTLSVLSMLGAMATLAYVFGLVAQRWVLIAGIVVTVLAVLGQYVLLKSGPQRVNVDEPEPPARG